MNPSLTEGQLSILHSLHDGDDPILRAPDADLIYYVRDVRLLVELGLIQPGGRHFVLTEDAREVLDALRGMPAPLRGDSQDDGFGRTSSCQR